MKSTTENTNERITKMNNEYAGKIQSINTTYTTLKTNIDSNNTQLNTFIYSNNTQLNTLKQEINTNNKDVSNTIKTLNDNINDMNNRIIPIKDDINDIKRDFALKTYVDEKEDNISGSFVESLQQLSQEFNRMKKDSENTTKSVNALYVLIVTFVIFF